MPSLPTTPGFNWVLLGALAVFAWYTFQVISRKRERVLFKSKRFIVSLLAYGFTAAVLLRQGLPGAETILISLLVGLGAGWLVVKAPKHQRRIPSDVRKAVIARDLTSKGLKWNPRKHHIDHIVPFSRGGDSSIRNLRVIEKSKNLRKAGKMPDIRDLF